MSHRLTYTEKEAAFKEVEALDNILSSEWIIERLGEITVGFLTWLRRVRKAELVAELDALSEETKHKLHPESWRSYGEAMTAVHKVAQ